MPEDTPMIDVSIRLPLPVWEAFTAVCAMRKTPRDAVVQEALEDLVKAWEIASDLAVLSWLTNAAEHKEPSEEKGP